MYDGNLSTFDYTQLQLYSHLSVLPVFQSVHVLEDISKCYVNSIRFIEVIGFIYPSGQYCYFHLDVFVKKMLLEEVGEVMYHLNTIH